MCWPELGYMTSPGEREGSCCRSCLPTQAGPTTVQTWPLLAEGWLLVGQQTRSAAAAYCFPAKEIGRGRAVPLNRGQISGGRDQCTFHSSLGFHGYFLGIMPSHGFGPRLLYKTFLYFERQDHQVFKNTELEYPVLPFSCWVTLCHLTSLCLSFSSATRGRVKESTSQSCS